MKTHLMHRERDFDRQQQLPWNEPALTQDLELDTVLRAMAGDDEFVFDVARRTLLCGLRNDMDTILYRQQALRDCLKNPAEVRALYAIAAEVVERRKKLWFVSFTHPSGILYSAIQLMHMFMEILGRLRSFANAHADQFGSESFTALFALIEKELDDEYFARIRRHLAELKFSNGILMSAEPGEDNAGTNHVLRQPHGKSPNWFKRIFSKGPPAHTFRIDPRDESGSRILAALQDRGINQVANALAQSADHIQSFFNTLQTELAFYVGCLNLYDRFAVRGEPVCFPQPFPAGTRKHRFAGLYDASLALHVEARVVGNTVDADGKSLVLVTGANQGGKSSFLRGIGLAQLMMQCGMYVSAESFDGELCNGLLTHYKREEDATMQKGKLDEELARMSDITDHLAPDSMLLFNESFAATNEREGSEIARQVVGALLERRIKVCFVTHLYDFAHSFFDNQSGNAIFLRAERRDDGTRTFRMIGGEPLETSYGEDLYRKIFPDAPQETR